MSAIDLMPHDELTRCCPIDPDWSGLGTLKTPQGNLPLKMLQVSAKISGLLSHVHVRQTFVNTLGVPLEATYIFPLPSRAAVSKYRFEIGERIIDGVLKERGEARRTYDQAIASGHRASITEEERPGVFTVRVGNLMPGEEVSVHLTLSGPLPYSEGEATFQFPLVVAPRYMPGSALSGEQVGEGTSHDTDAVPDASRISPPVLLKGFPNPIQLSLCVEIDAGGLPLGQIRSSLHAVRVSQEDGVQRIELRPGERLDRDFILRFGVGSETLGSSLQLSPDADGEGEGTFQLTVVPPLGMAKTVEPRDVAFVLDRSGSMGGWKMIAARRACARMLDTLTDQDRFSVLAFDTSIETPKHQMAGQMVQATDRNRFRAVEFLAGIESRGGTEMALPLERAADELLAGETSGRDRILVLITDGQVGNEDQILRTLGSKFERMRVFTLGIDRAVNAAFLRRLAGMGGGYCELVESEDRLDEVMDKVHRRIGTPLLTHLDLEVGEGTGIEIIEGSMSPRRLPDMFAGTPLQIRGRYRGKPDAVGALQVRASDGVGEPWTDTIRGSLARNPAITACWARGYLRDQEDRLQTLSGSARGDLVHTITSASLRFSVLCRFTAFVAVDRAEVVNRGGQVHKVTQAVETPQGCAGPSANQPAPPPRRAEMFFRIASSTAASLPACFSPPAGAMCGDPFAAPEASAFGSGAGDRIGALPPSRALAPRSSALGGKAHTKRVRAKTASRPRVKKPKPSKNSGSGFLGKVTQTIFGGADDRKPTDGLSTGLAAGYRRRVEDLLEVLAVGEGAALDVRRREVSRLATLLETLLEDLRSVGTAASVLKPLEELQAALVQARNSAPAEAHLLALMKRARAVLEACVAGHPTAPVPETGRGESFWF